MWKFSVFSAQLLNIYYFSGDSFHISHFQFSSFLWKALVLFQFFVEIGIKRGYIRPLKSLYPYFKRNV